MPKLIAQFDIELDAPLLVERTQVAELAYDFKYNEFDIQVRLIPGSFSMTNNEIDWVFGIHSLEINVGRYEETNIPEVEITPEGHRDYSVQQFYFQEILPFYSKVAVEITNRIIMFFKYKIHNPFLDTVFDDRHCFRNPIWLNENGHKAGIGMHAIILTKKYGFRRELGTQRLTEHQDQSLLDAIANPSQPTLVEEILSDAQEAIFRGDFRRGVLELAIACEIQIKQTFFAKSTFAGAAFEFLEEKQKVEVSNTELIHTVAQRAFGESFRDKYEKDYDNIDFLFRCRNKVAHQGELIYRGNDKKTHSVDENKLNEWWVSVEKLLKWLNQHRELD